MSKAEKFIDDCTRYCSNEILSPYPQIINDVRRIGGEPAKEFSQWLSPDQARKAVEIAREEVIDKAIGWIEEINNRHYIMRYSDSCEPPISELTEWFKNYMKEGCKDE